MRTAWRDGDRTRNVELLALGGGRYRASVDEAEIEVGIEPIGPGRFRLLGEHGARTVEITAAGSRRFVRVGTLDFALEVARGPGRARAAQSGGLEAPMPGVVTRVLVSSGAYVQRGQPLLALEAMKMEHLIRAPRDGRIRSVSARAGEMVSGGATLVEMEEEGPASGGA
jgi:3-methylcrotonyl-CoA carboxylase alpha subunit